MSTPSPIYLDHAATTPLDARVHEAMQPYLGAAFGNPSSLHAPGRAAREAVETARAQVAALLGVAPDEIAFTGGGTESDNLALMGVLEALELRGCHVVTSAIEHPAVLETCKYLERRGAAVALVRPGADGIVHPDAVAAAMQPDTRIVSVMAANNVTGVVQPIAAIAAVAHAGGAWFHTDAVQAAGKIPIDAERGGIDLLSLSGHKIHGPQGIGALYVRTGTPIAPILHGGGQERGLRSGTESVAAIVGLGRAAELARSEMDAESPRLARLHSRIVDFALEHIAGAYLVGHAAQRLPGHACLAFDGLEPRAIELLLALDEAGIAASSGSACSASHATEPSYVLRAMGFDVIRARGSLRVTLGRGNTQAEVDRFLDVLESTIARMRKRQ